MFRNSYQNGFLSLLYSCGSSPLAIWDKHVKNGYIKRVTDDEVKSLALEIAGTNVATTYIFCPIDPKKVLGIKLPFLIMIIKNMKKYFTFEITILDDKNMHRRFRVSNFQSTTRVRPFCTTMPIGLSGGWNQIQFNLADFTRRAYGTNYVETTRMQIHANCRIRRIYFADRLYTEDEMPDEFKLFLPIGRKKCVREEKSDVRITSSAQKADALLRASKEQLVKEPAKERSFQAANVEPEVIEEPVPAPSETEGVSETPASSPEEEETETQESEAPEEFSPEEEIYGEESSPPGEEEEEEGEYPSEEEG